MSFIPEEEEIIRVDRSTLERWGDTDACPHREGLVRLYGIDVVGRAAEIGEHVHRVLAAVTRSYVEDPDALLHRAEHWVDMLTNEVWVSQDDELVTVRPDIVSEAATIIDKMAWQFARFLTKTNPKSILAFDGGEGERSAQLHRDIRVANKTIRVTTELDLLIETHDPGVLEDWDYKTGMADWDTNKVYHSFQFQLHAWLVLQTYPDIEELHVKIWAPQKGKIVTAAFKRRDLDRFAARVNAAVSAWMCWSQQRVELMPPLPTTEKCELCPVSIYCQSASRPAVEIAAHPGVLLAHYVAGKARQDELKRMLWAYRDQLGTDIVFEGTGLAFGLDKPKKPSKPQDPVYRLPKTE